MPLYMVYTKLCTYLVLSRKKFLRGKMERIVTVNYQYWRGCRDNLLQTIFSTSPSLICDYPFSEEIIQQNIVLKIQFAFLLLQSGAKLFARICVRHVNPNHLQPEIKKVNIPSRTMVVIDAKRILPRIMVLDNEKIILSHRCNGYRQPKQHSVTDNGYWRPKQNSVTNNGYWRPKQNSVTNNGR